MRKNEISGNVDKLGTQMLHLICQNEGSTRDREMLITALVVAFERLKGIHILSQLNKDDALEKSITKDFKLISDILSGKVSIKDGKIVRVARPPS